NTLEYLFFMAKKTTNKIEDDIHLIKSDEKRYIEKRVKLFALNLVESITKYPVETVYKLVGSIFLLGAFAFLSVALALYVGVLLHNLVLGFVVASGPYLIGSLFLLLKKPSIMVRKIQDVMTEKIVKEVN